MLLIALSIHKRRKQYPAYEGLKWGESQIAIEVILLKSRSLMEFLSPLRRSGNDITITDFGLPIVILPRTLSSFRASVNQWSAHLSRQRVFRSPSRSAQPPQNVIEVTGLWLLKKADEMVSECLLSGVAFSEERHKRFYRVFQSEFEKIVGGTS